MLFTAKGMPDHQNLRYSSRSKCLIPKSEGDAFGEPPHRFRRIGSSGLNLFCDELLLGMRVGGPEVVEAEVTLHLSLGKHSLYNNIYDTPSSLLQDQVVHTMEPQLEIVLGVILCRGPQDGKGGGGRQQHTKGIGA
jgi:hypothetical protein